MVLHKWFMQVKFGLSETRPSNRVHVQWILSFLEVPGSWHEWCVMCRHVSPGDVPARAALPQALTSAGWSRFPGLSISHPSGFQGPWHTVHTCVRACNDLFRQSVPSYVFCTLVILLRSWRSFNYLHCTISYTLISGVPAMKIPFSFSPRQEQRCPCKKSFLEGFLLINLFFFFSSVESMQWGSVQVRNKRSCAKTRSGNDG